MTRRKEAAVPRISIDLNQDEFSRLSDRAFAELRNPRDEARIIVREGLGLPRTLPPHGEAADAPSTPVNRSRRGEALDGRAA